MESSRRSEDPSLFMHHGESLQEGREDEADIERSSVTSAVGEQYSYRIACGENVWPER